MPWGYSGSSVSEFRQVSPRITAFEALLRYPRTRLELPLARPSPHSLVPPGPCPGGASSVREPSFPLPPTGPGSGQRHRRYSSEAAASDESEAGSTAGSSVPQGASIGDLFMGSTREVLARLVDGDPLGLRLRVVTAIRERALLVDVEQVLLQAQAACARQASEWRGHPSIDLWLAERVDEVLDRMLTDGDPSGPDDTFGILAASLQLNPESLGRATDRFHRLSVTDRQAFCALVLDGRSLESVRVGHRMSPSELAHRARRALHTLRFSSTSRSTPLLFGSAT